MEWAADYAIFGDTVATGLVDVATDPAALDRGGWWAVTVTFEGDFRAYRFAHQRPLLTGELPVGGVGVGRSSWASSLDRDSYMRAVADVRADIARGWVYQVNVCRVLTAPVPEGFDAPAAYGRLVDGNPAPYAGMLHVVSRSPQTVLSASPELLVRRDGRRLVSGPIKGTASSESGLLDKDRAENVMIVDLVRNDMARVAAQGTVEVEALMRTEHHPGLVHLVSDVACDVREGAQWTDILSALLPAGSVSGAPKSSALEVIARLEPVPRGIYCGAFGWVDADRDAAQLAVGIRTFWVERGQIHFGTGAGITWGSDPAREWDETELKAARLLAVLDGGAPALGTVG